MDSNKFNFPPPGQGIDAWSRSDPTESGLDPAVIDSISEFVTANPNAHPRCSPRWGLWRNGSLIHAEIENPECFTETIDVASL